MPRSSIFRTGKERRISSGPSTEKDVTLTCTKSEGDWGAASAQISRRKASPCLSWRSYSCYRQYRNSLEPVLRKESLTKIVYVGQKNQKMHINKRNVSPAVPTISSRLLLNKNEVIICNALFCNLLLACQQTCILMIILMASQLSSPLPFIFSCKLRCALPEHWDAPFAFMLCWGTRSLIRRTFPGLQAEVTNRDAARYHFLPIAASVNKINWAGQPLLQQLFTWPFQASLRC